MHTMLIHGVGKVKVSKVRELKGDGSHCFVRDITVETFNFRGEKGWLTFTLFAKDLDEANITLVNEE